MASDLQPKQMVTNKFFTYLSPAKLNLGLKIIGRQADGYHILNTTFCLIDLFDEVNIQVTNNGKISLLDHNQAWFYQKDLAYKAGQLLQHKTKTKLGANIKIKKTIPSGSGLGGGSSDAATVLMALNQLWKTNLTTPELMNLGRHLGADVPFFIYGKNAIATGIGDIFTETEIPEQYFVIVVPDFHLSTRDVFEQFNKLNITTSLINSTKNSAKDSTLQNHELNHELIHSTENHLENDLQFAAIYLKPELGNIIKSMQKHGVVTMTGSGSALYLRYSDKNIAKKVAKEMSSSYNTYLVSRLTTSPLYNDF